MLVQGGVSHRSPPCRRPRLPQTPTHSKPGSTKRKAEAETIVAQEEEKKRVIAAEAARREADLKTEAAKRESSQRVELEKEAADQRLALQQQETEQRLTHDREVSQRKLVEDRDRASAESQRKFEQGLKSGAIPVGNLGDAIKKYDARDGATLVQQPPLTVTSGYWHLSGQLKSVEKNVPGQKGKVYMCSSSRGMFAFVTSKDVTHLRINQQVGIVGKHVATEEAVGQNASGAPKTVYVPIFNATEVLGD